MSVNQNPRALDPHCWVICIFIIFYFLIWAFAFSGKGDDLVRSYTCGNNETISVSKEHQVVWCNPYYYNTTAMDVPAFLFFSDTILYCVFITCTALCAVMLCRTDIISFELVCLEFAFILIYWFFFTGLVYEYSQFSNSRVHITFWNAIFSPFISICASIRIVIVCMVSIFKKMMQRNKFVPMQMDGFTKDEEGLEEQPIKL